MVFVFIYKKIFDKWLCRFTFFAWYEISDTVMCLIYCHLNFFFKFSLALFNHCRYSVTPVYTWYFCVSWVI